MTIKEIFKLLKAEKNFTVEQILTLVQSLVLSSEDTILDLIALEQQLAQINIDSRATPFNRKSPEAQKIDEYVFRLKMLKLREKFVESMQLLKEHPLKDRLFIQYIHFFADQKNERLSATEWQKILSWEEGQNDRVTAKFIDTELSNAVNQWLREIKGIAIDHPMEPIENLIAIFQQADTRIASIANLFQLAQQTLLEFKNNFPLWKKIHPKVNILYQTIEAGITYPHKLNDFARLFSDATQENNYEPAVAVLFIRLHYLQNLSPADCNQIFNRLQLVLNTLVGGQEAHQIRRRILLNRLLADIHRHFGIFVSTTNQLLYRRLQDAKEKYEFNMNMLRFSSQSESDQYRNALVCLDMITYVNRNYLSFMGNGESYFFNLAYTILVDLASKQHASACFMLDQCSKIYPKIYANIITNYVSGPSQNSPHYWLWKSALLGYLSGLRKIAHLAANNDFSICPSFSELKLTDLSLAFECIDFLLQKAGLPRSTSAQIFLMLEQLYQCQKDYTQPNIKKLSVSQLARLEWRMAQNLRYQESEVLAEEHENPAQEKLRHQADTIYRRIATHSQYPVLLRAAAYNELRLSAAVTNALHQSEDEAQFIRLMSIVLSKPIISDAANFVDAQSIFTGQDNILPLPILRRVEVSTRPPVIAHPDYHILNHHLRSKIKDFLVLLLIFQVLFVAFTSPIYPYLKQSPERASNTHTRNVTALLNLFLPAAISMKLWFISAFASLAFILFASREYNIRDLYGMWRDRRMGFHHDLVRVDTLSECHELALFAEDKLAVDEPQAVLQLIDVEALTQIFNLLKDDAGLPANTSNSSPAQNSALTAPALLPSPTSVEQMQRHFIHQPYTVAEDSEQEPAEKIIHKPQQPTR